MNAGLNAGLILAGGSGLRAAGLGKPKQFVEVDGKPLICYCVDAFAECPDIGCVCVVVHEKWRCLLGEGFVFAEPGESRQHSVYSGLLALKAQSPKNVIIHDAARPLVTPRDIAAVIRAAGGYDGATPALPVTETIYQSEGGETITRALVRDELFFGQTPECYDYKKYTAAHENLPGEALLRVRGSSEVAVNSNMRIALCEGSPGNFKITSNADLQRFKSIINDRRGRALCEEGFS